MGNVPTYTTLSPEALLDLRPYDIETVNREYTAAIYHVGSSRAACDFALAIDEVGKLFEKYPSIITCFKTIEGIEQRFASEGHLDIISTKFEKFMQETEPDIRVPRSILNALTKMLRNNVMRKPILTSSIPKTSMSVLAKFTDDENLTRETASVIATKLGKDISLLDRERARSFAFVLIAALRLHANDEKLVALCLPVIKHYTRSFEMESDSELLYTGLTSILPDIVRSSHLLEQTFDILSIAIAKKKDITDRYVSTADMALSELSKSGPCDEKCYTAIIRWLCRSGMSADDIAFKIIDDKIRGVGYLIKDVYESHTEAQKHAAVLIALSRHETVRLECRKNLESVEMAILGVEYALSPDGFTLERLIQLQQILNKIK
jgi:hypothetical protein